MKCWNCGADTQGRPFCPACGKIAQRAPGATHFEVFGLPRSTRVELAALEKAYRELSLKLHPDRFAKAEALERRLSLEQTTALNDAFKTLKDPVRRATYLLRLAGIDLDKDEAVQNKKIPVEFLEEILERREALNEAREGKDVEAAQRMGEDVKQHLDAALAEANAKLEALPAEEDPGREDAVIAAAAPLVRVRYYQRFLDEVSAIEEEALG